MENLKIRVNNEAESKEAQELFFKLGGKWGIGGRNIQYTNAHFLYLEDGIVIYGDSDVAFNMDADKEITLPELRAMVNPMKEYLVPDNGGYRVAVQDAGLPIAEDWIEILEGAEALTKEVVGSEEMLLWWRNNFSKCIGHDNHLSNHEIDVCNHLERNPKPVVLWQREQDEPFLTPETTLNDQYAEIEQVRQDEKQERNSSAWDVQIGGNHYKQFKIQPMQFALENKLDAAQHNVIKYIMRHSFKNGKQDLEKAKHYIDLMIEFYYGENNND